jgi:putative ABC transport system permease protein
MYLPLANILHHKLRSLLSAAGIGVGICMLVTLAGLSRGSLYEIADRWESVDADLIVFPRGWGDNATAKSGAGLSQNLSGVLQNKHGDIIEKVVPVFTWSMKLAGQDHMATGISPEDWEMLSGGNEFQEGRIFDPKNLFSKYIKKELLTPDEASDDETFDELSAAQLAQPGRSGLELVIDSRLARAGKLAVGDKVTAANHEWTIVGIIPAGVMTRIFLPLRTAQYLFGSGDITKCTLFFIKLKRSMPPGQSIGQIAGRLSKKIRQDVVPLESYRGMLVQKWGVMFTYVDAINTVALVIAFLFVMTTLYTMVLQRTREIAILKSCGASGGFIVRQVISESLILTAIGTAMGIGMSLGAGWAIQKSRPLLTVEISFKWIGIAILAATAGALISAIYPAWSATRVDMVEALSYE